MFTVEDVQNEHGFHTVGDQTLLSVVRSLLGDRAGRPDEEQSLKPGSWGPVIRAAVERITLFAPAPEPWVAIGREIARDRTFEPLRLSLLLSAVLARHPELFDATGGGRLRADDDLNPQPLPPRLAFAAALVQTVVSRAELMHEIAGNVTREGEQRGIIIVGGYTSRFADEFCGTNFHLVWPEPGPKPHWFAGTLDGLDLLVMASQFDSTARATFGAGLQQSFADASARFLKAAVARF